MKATRTVKTILAVFLALALALSVAGGALAADQRLSIGTASTGGSWYPLGGGVANMINKYIKGYYASAHPSGASIENIRAVMKGQDAMALSMPDAALYAYEGKGAFEGKPQKNLRGLFSTYPVDIQFYVLADSPVKTIADIKGKNLKVAVGAPGSGTEKMAQYVLKVYGITYDDIDEQFLSATETTAAMKDGNIDVGIVTLGTPAPTLMDLATQREIRFLDIEPAVAQKINKDFPAYFPRTIPAGTYKNMTKPHHTLAWMGLFVVNADMSDQLAYDICKAVFDHKAELDKIHKKFALINLESATSGMSVPLHPGAVKFFKERGILK
ncbi:MAG: TAXI family TRAP transporter solute-binding subunit [Desulfarculaceae bacterium]|nr:TAXI family TRAP transporter solute-binding subunit [Desulfarculaceae bacterium]MCF8047856.1 TAXI family TRAP transporter solute-binding subunit [Desulfarculaceae bacterium]MCF8066030.1 TAXI family TRAP transporter solute-binding subunit [Desulfarculaceae bacterium]MCF8096740.1 TAXI family TRAP transporter solute-binding subunit [Desulfarculaceae bacterium]MCF8123036.1 TAXI family TRAP transporter solute-binding subunit [Desulfarculaceae bacterium]